MNNSTEGVTLYAGFLFDLLRQFKGSKDTFARDLFMMAEDLDPKKPTTLVPIQLYNDMCQWIEDSLSTANLRSAGVEIGLRVYDQMVQGGDLGDNPQPLDMMRELKRVAGFMIQDPLDRQWEILEVHDASLLMRRTQTYNCILQEGLLHSLVKRTGVMLTNVEHVSCTRRGDEFCEYRIGWMPKS